MSKLEKYEWDSLWWEEPENKSKRHVLYIGDSISRGTTPKLNALSQTLAVDNFATSKAVDNPCFLRAMQVFAAQNPGYDTLLFNNGLHGFHLSTEDFEKLYEELFVGVSSLFQGVKPYIVLSTFSRTKLNQETVIRNEAAKRVAKKYGAEVIDLYSVSKTNEDLLTADNVHFSEDGYALLAKEIFDRI